MDYFTHDQLEIKKHFLNIARDYHQKSSGDDDTALAYELAAALLYMNMSDYLAQYLATLIQGLVDYSISRFYFASIKRKKVPIHNITIEQSIKILQDYEFSNREEILSKLSEVKKDRNTLAHEILKTKAEELNKIDEAVENLKVSTEELISMVDALQLALPPKSMDQLVEEMNETNDKSMKK